MLRSLLLLCWAATIVSAGIYKNDISNTSVPGNLVGDNVATNSELPLETSKLSPIKEDAHMPSVLSESNKPVTLEASNENIPSNDSMTALSTINSTTTSTIETKSISTTSTSKPTTTSTSKPTTTSTSKPTTSTPIPTTTPVPSTTIPVPTTPLPPPSTGTWQIRQDNKLCIMIQMAAQFNVSYNNATISFHKVMDIPANSNATGNCSEQTEQTLTLSWGSKDNSTVTAQNNFTLHFVKNDKLYSLHHFEISLAVEKTPTDKSNKTVTVMTMAPQFSTGLNNSYRCLKEQSLNLIFKGENKTVGELKISNLQFQAFRNDNTTIFGLAKDCSFDTPDIVPITVGCALAGLVVVVLIAYLVGRRRSQSRGYLSM